MESNNNTKVDNFFYFLNNLFELGTEEADEILEMIAQAIEKAGENAESMTDVVFETLEVLKNQNWYKNLLDVNQKIINKNVTDFIYEQEGMLISLKDYKLAIPSELIRDYVKSGIKDFNELVDKIHVRVAEDFPNIPKIEVSKEILKYAKSLKRNEDEKKTDEIQLLKKGKEKLENEIKILLKKYPVLKDKYPHIKF